jgi:hypothetical protein
MNVGLYSALIYMIDCAMYTVCNIIVWFTCLVHSSEPNAFMVFLCQTLRTRHAEAE